jgi:hypothetical protein
VGRGYEDRKCTDEGSEEIEDADEGVWKYSLHESHWVLILETGQQRHRTQE